MLLRDQFVMGLREGPIQQELRAQVRRDRQLTSEDVRKEALALESERQDLWAPSAPVFTQNVAVKPATDWKQTFCRELMQERTVNELVEAAVGSEHEEIEDASVVYGEGRVTRSPGQLVLFLYLSL
ncbi:hypothetical protein G5714_008806 [Onychostoma macrolepis]|uniref:Uncharacterized protein n=1 Tax=Onychostoma macrolepis TaxID=369639 RepID=A0A7J6CRD9_9TELE|nr:hypothetical protein G5714_008806 [Onychostoma macrolepis]